VKEKEASFLFVATKRRRDGLTSSYKKGATLPPSLPGPKRKGEGIKEGGGKERYVIARGGKGEREAITFSCFS